MNEEQEKLEALQEMTGLDVSALGAAKKQEAEDAGRESKEVKEEIVVEEVQEPVVPVLTPELIGQALAAALQPVLNRMDVIEKAQAELVEEKEIADPLAIMMGAYQSNVIGQPDARVDGRTKEAKDAPKERQTDGFTAPRAKVKSDSLPAQVINRLFSNTTAKELSGMRQ